MTVSLSAVIVDVAGVGYEVTVGARTLRMLPPVGETVTLAIETHMREDAIRLYGFATEHERAWFRALQTVQGVGAKVALAVLGTLVAVRARQCRGAPGQGAGRACAGRRSQGRGAHRRRAQGQDAVSSRPRSGRLAGSRRLPRCPKGVRRGMRFRHSPISAMPMARRLPPCRKRSAKPAAKRAPRC